MAYETVVVAEDEAYWALEGFAGDVLGGGVVVVVVEPRLVPARHVQRPA